MPVLPPTAASTIASSVVGTFTRRTPRSHVAAAKPAMSVVAPPPMATTASLRPRRILPAVSHREATTSRRLPSSASGWEAVSTS